MFTIHNQIQFLNSVLDGAFRECIYIGLTWVVYSFYSHVLSLLKPARKPIIPSTVGASIPYDTELMRQALDVLIHDIKEEEMKLKPITKISAIIRDLEDNKPTPPLQAEVTATLYTIRELKALASKAKVKGYSNMTKAQLIENLHL